MQCAGQVFGELARQADEQFIAGEIKPQRQSRRRIAFLIIGVRKSIASLQTSFRIQRISRRGGERVNIAVVRTMDGSPLLAVTVRDWL